MGNKESSIGDQEKLGVVDHTRSFLKRQKTNFKLMVARDSLLLVSGRKSEARSRSLGGYEWIYLERLGATSLQIGSVNGVLSFLSVALSVPAGWLIDRVKNIKNLYLISSLLGVPAVLLLVYANDWIGFLLIMMWYTIAASIQLPSKLIVDIDSLNDNDRVAGLSIHRTITALAGVAPPLMIAYVIDRFGGIDTARGLRPVFYLQFAAEAVIVSLFLLKLQNVFVKKQHDKSLLGGLKYILKGPTPLKLSLMGEIAAAFFSGMLNPFVGIYQVDIKMATVFIFAWVNVAEPAVDILFSLPAARFIGRFGRRKMAYLGHIIGICGRVLLVLIPSSLPQLLILYSVLGSVEGCLYLGFDAYSQEIIPQDVRGKWVGIRNTIIGTMGIFAPVLGGFLWTMNPDYLFWLQVVHWTIIAFPIMIILMEKYSTDGRVVSGN